MPSYSCFAAERHFGQNAVRRAFRRFVAARAARCLSRPAGDLAIAMGCPGRPGLGGVVSRVAELWLFGRRAACRQNAVERAFRPDQESLCVRKREGEGGIQREGEREGEGQRREGGRRCSRELALPFVRSAHCARHHARRRPPKTPPPSAPASTPALLFIDQAKLVSASTVARPQLAAIPWGGSLGSLFRANDGPLAPDVRSTVSDKVFTPPSAFCTANFG